MPTLAGAGCGGACGGSRCCRLLCKHSAPGSRSIELQEISIYSWKQISELSINLSSCCLALISEVMCTHKNGCCSGDIDYTRWGKSCSPLPAGREEQLGSHSKLFWERRERATVSKAKRYNPTLGTPTLPTGAGEDGGSVFGGQRVPACPWVLCRQLAPAAGGAAGLSRTHWGARGLVIPPPG